MTVIGGGVNKDFAAVDGMLRDDVMQLTRRSTRSGRILRDTFVVRVLVRASSIVPTMALLGLIYEVKDSLLAGKCNHNDPLTRKAFTVW